MEDVEAAGHPGPPTRERARRAGAGGGADRPDAGPQPRPDGTWDPVVDYQMMSRNLRGFMSLFHSDKPTVCKVHGYCVAGGTDMALCSDLLVVEDSAKIGYPPRVWGVPTSALGIPDWPGAGEAPPAHRRLDRRDHRGRVGLASEAALGSSSTTVRGAARAGRERPDQPAGDAQAARQPGLYAQGLQATQALGVFFDGIARHTPEGFACMPGRRGRVQGSSPGSATRLLATRPLGRTRRTGLRAVETRVREPRDHRREHQAVATRDLPRRHGDRAGRDHRRG